MFSYVSGKLWSARKDRKLCPAEGKASPWTHQSKGMRRKISQNPNKGATSQSGGRQQFVPASVCSLFLLNTSGLLLRSAMKADDAESAPLQTWPLPSHTNTIVPPWTHPSIAGYTHGWLVVSTNAKALQEICRHHSPEASAAKWDAPARSWKQAGPLKTVP